MDKTNTVGAIVILPEIELESENLVMTKQQTYIVKMQQAMMKKKQKLVLLSVDKFWKKFVVSIYGGLFLLNDKKHN